MKKYAAIVPTITAAPTTGPLARLVRPSRTKNAATLNGREVKRFTRRSCADGSTENSILTNSAIATTTSRARKMSSSARVEYA